MSHLGEKKSEALVYVNEATDIYYSPEGGHGPDRVYHAKARLLNTAVHEIGVGKYQARPLPYISPADLTNLSSAAMALLRHRFRMVRRQSVACKHPISPPKMRLTRRRSSLA